MSLKLSQKKARFFLCIYHELTNAFVSIFTLVYAGLHVEYLCKCFLFFRALFKCVNVCDAHFCLTASSFCVPLPLCVLPVCPAHLARSDRPRNKRWERSKIIEQHERSSAMWYKCTETLIVDTYSESFPEEK